MKWPRVKLGDILSLEYGKPLPASERNAGGSVLVAGSNGPDGTHTEAFVNGPGVVVGRKGSAGKVCWYDHDFWPIDTTYFIAPKSPIDVRWAYYLLSHLRLERLATTTGVPGLNRNDAYDLEVPFPPLSEQRRIVAILDEVDRLHCLRNGADSKSVRIIPALFFKVFGDPTTNQKGWPVKSIGELATLVTSGSTPRGGAEVYVKEGPYLIRSQNVLMNRLDLSDVARITNETHSQMSRTHVRLGDVLLNITGASIGRVAWVKRLDAEANVNQHVCIIRVDPMQITPAFLSMYLSLPQQQSIIASVQAGASRQALNHEQVRSLRVLVPPLALQSAFADNANVAEELLEQSDHASRRLEDLFNVLTQRAFSGELTAKWREAHVRQLLVEMAEQMNLLNLPLAKAGRAAAET